MVIRQGIEAIEKKPRSAKSFFRIAERAERSLVRKRVSNTYVPVPDPMYWRVVVFIPRNWD